MSQVNGEYMTIAPDAGGGGGRGHGHPINNTVELYDVTREFMQLKLIIRY